MGVLSRVRPASLTLRALARLLAYPDAGLRAHLSELKQALHKEQALSPERLNCLDALIDALGRKDGLECEADYVELFDRGRATSLHLFEHVHGDSRDRGPAMVDLARTYASAGLELAPGELPDYLPAVLEFASVLEPAEARAFLGETTHILNALYNALQQRNSLYAGLLAALIELAGGKPEPLRLAPEEPLDASWAEPPAFDRCSMQGQERGDRPQPVHVVRRSSAGGPRP